MIDVAREIREVVETTTRCLALAPAIAESGERIVKTLERGNKILVCGNGGSAADAQHFAAELVGRFELERRGVPCLALNADGALMTALANDHGYGAVFARQVAAFGVEGDLLIGISTSGNSASVVNALEEARAMRLERIALLGRGGGQIGRMEGASIVCAPADRTARIQEVHAMVVHIWAQMVDAAFAPVSSPAT